MTKLDTRNHYYYYLTTINDLLSESKYGVDLVGEKEFFGTDQVKKYWYVNMNDRTEGWNFLIEASAMGAKKKYTDHLVKHWEMTNEDAYLFADASGYDLGMDGNQYCVNLKGFDQLTEHIFGFGNTAFEAFVNYKEQELEL